MNSQRFTVGASLILFGALAVFLVLSLFTPIIWDWTTLFGTWNIDEVVQTVSVVDIEDEREFLENSGALHAIDRTPNSVMDGIEGESKVLVNSGTIHFDREQEGSFKFTYEGETISGGFNWFKKWGSLYTNTTTPQGDILTGNQPIAWEWVVNNETQQQFRYDFMEIVEVEDDSGNLVDRLERTQITVTLSRP